MNEATATLFDEFAVAYRRGEAPDVLAYLDRAGDDADALADLIDRFLQAVPAREPTEEEIVLARARLESEPPMLVLRVRRALTRDAVVETLVRALGLDAAKSAKVKRYYSDLEVGVLDPAPVDARVWDVLADLLKANVRRLAEHVPTPPVTPLPDYLREGDASWSPALASTAPAASIDALMVHEKVVPEPPDEIDRLFRGPNEP